MSTWSKWLAFVNNLKYLHIYGWRAIRWFVKYHTYIYLHIFQVNFLFRIFFYPLVSRPWARGIGRGSTWSKPLWCDVRLLHIICILIKRDPQAHFAQRPFPNWRMTRITPPWFVGSRKWPSPNWAKPEVTPILIPAEPRRNRIGFLIIRCIVQFAWFGGFGKKASLLNLESPAQDIVALSPSLRA